MRPIQEGPIHGGGPPSFRAKRTTAMRTTHHRRGASAPELLEARIAPAATFINATTATFTDVDGDFVTVKFSKGLLTAANVGGVLETTPAGTLGGDQLTRIDINTNPDSAGANLTVTATPQDANLDDFIDGDGLVNVGWIDATAIDLGAVVVDGDLGKIVVGDPVAATAAVKSLTAHSLGRFGTGTGAPDLASIFTGRLAALKVLTNITDATLTAGAIGQIGVAGAIAGNPFANQIESSGDIGSIKVGRGMEGQIESVGGRIGSVTVGGDAGTIRAAGDIGPVKIGGGVFRIQSTGGKLGSVTIAGDVPNLQSAGDMGAIVIRGSTGGGMIASGGRIASLTVSGGAQNTITAAGDIGAVKIGGDFGLSITSTAGRIASAAVGGDFLGALSAAAGIGAVTVGGDFGSATLGSARITTAGRLAKVDISGDFLGGTRSSTGEIFSQLDLGPVKIGGDLIGGTQPGSGFIHTAGKLAGVSIAGSLLGGTAPDAGHLFSTGDMGQVTIGHGVRGGSGEYTGAIRSAAKLAGVTIGHDLLGGFGPDSGVVRSAGDLGAVTIGRDLQGGFFGSGASGVVTSDAKIASVTIGGDLRGGRANDRGMILAGGELGAVKIAGSLFGGSLSSGDPSSDRTGYIQGSRIGSVAIGGSIQGGFDASFSGDLFRNASIRAVHDIGSIAVAGDIRPSAQPVVISAQGKASLPGAGDVAIGKITVGGNLSNADIRAGYDVDLIARNADAQIGTVSVGGDWISSS